MTGRTPFGVGGDTPGWVTVRDSETVHHAPWGSPTKYENASFPLSTRWGGGRGVGRAWPGGPRPTRPPLRFAERGVFSRQAADIPMVFRQQDLGGFGGTGCAEKHAKMRTKSAHWPRAGPWESLIVTHVFANRYGQYCPAAVAPPNVRRVPVAAILPLGGKAWQHFCSSAARRWPAEPCHRRL
jgi:hypothetical protein